MTGGRALTSGRAAVLALSLMLAACAFSSVVYAENHDGVSNPSAGSGDAFILDLETALGTAINNNFELRVIKAQKGIQELVIRERWRDYFPTLTLSYMQTEDQRKREADSRLHKLSVDSKIIVYDGGRRGLAYDTAKLKSILARNDYRIAINRFIAEVSRAFFQALYSREAVSIHAKTVERSAMQLTFIRKELELGEATRLDALAVEAQVREAELNLEKAKDDLSQTMNRLKLILKIDWRTPVSITGNIEKDFELRPLDESHSEDRLVSLALKNRKEVESIDIEHMISKRNYEISSSSYLPKFSMGLNYSHTGEEFMPREKGWGVNFEVSSMLLGNSVSANGGYHESGNGNSRAISQSESVGVLDSMSYKRAVLESVVELKSAKEKKRSVRQEISLEVTGALAALSNSWKMITIARKQVELYDSFLEIERLKANMGESRRYDLVKKELERGEAAIAHLNSLITYIAASTGLEIAVGVDMGFFGLSRYTSRREHD